MTITIYDSTCRAQDLELRRCSNSRTVNTNRNCKLDISTALTKAYIRENQLIHRRLSKAKSICSGSDPWGGRQADSKTAMVGGVWSLYREGGGEKRNTKEFRDTRRGGVNFLNTEQRIVKRQLTGVEPE